MSLRAIFRKILRPGAGQLGTYRPRSLRLDYPREFVPFVASEWPVISIVIPTLNQANFLEATLKSIIEQSYPALELVVVDGGSVDNTIEIIKKYNVYIQWWVSEPDAGQADAINKGFLRTSGSIMAWINSDDLVAPGALYEVASYFNDNPGVQVVYGDRIVIDDDGFEIGRWILPRHSSAVLKWADFVPQETLYWRRGAWDSVGGLDVTFRFAMDWDFLLRLSSSGFNLKNSQKILGLFRVHASQKTSSIMSSIGRAEIEAIRFRELGFVPKRWQIIQNTMIYLFQARMREIIERLLAYKR